MPLDSIKTCSCGHDRSHSEVQPQCRYSFWGWVILLIGITTAPQRVEFVCRKCLESIETIEDPSALKKYQGL